MSEQDKTFGVDGSTCTACVVDKDGRHERDCPIFGVEQAPKGYEFTPSNDLIVDSGSNSLLGMVPVALLTEAQQSEMVLHHLRAEFTRTGLVKRCAEQTPHGWEIWEMGMGTSAHMQISFNTGDLEPMKIMFAGALPRVEIGNNSAVGETTFNMPSEPIVHVGVALDRRMNTQQELSDGQSLGDGIVDRGDAGVFTGGDGSITNQPSQPERGGDGADFGPSGRTVVVPNLGGGSGPEQDDQGQDQRTTAVDGTGSGPAQSSESDGRAAGVQDTNASDGRDQPSGHTDQA